MADNVVDLDKMRGTKHRATEVSPQTVEFDRARLDSTRAVQVRGEIAKCPRIEKANQRIQIAQNMWKIFRDVEQRGYRKATVLREAGLGDDLDSTKRAYNYALDPECDDEKRAAAAKRLTKTASKYVRLAEKAAEIANVSKDQYLLALVAGSQYDVAMDGDGSTVTVTNEFSYELSDFLTKLGRKIANKHNLSDYFKYLATRNIAFDDEKNAFHEMYSPFVSLPQFISVGEWEIGGSVTKFAPAIPLFFRDIGQYEAKFAIANISDNFEDGMSPAEIFDGIGYVYTYRDICLGFAPIGPGNSIELCFIIETSTSFSASLPELGEFECLQFGLPRFGLWDLVNASEDQYGRKIRYLISEEENERLGEAPSPFCSSHIELVSPNSCETFLAVTDWDVTIGQGGFEDMKPASQFSRAWGKTDAPSGSIASAIEDNFYGDDKDSRIDHLLARRVSKMVAALEKYRSDAERFLAIRRSEILREWD